MPPHISTLKKLDTSFDVNEDIEATRPRVDKNSLRRSRSVAIEDTDEVLYKDPDELVDGDVLEEEKKEESQVQAEDPVDIRHREFLHLQEGIMGVFYQNESHTRDLLAKQVELVEKWKEYEQKCDERFLKLEAYMIHTSDSVNELGEKIKYLAKKK
jgi:hypothetical protein